MRSGRLPALVVILVLLGSFAGCAAPTGAGMEAAPAAAPAVAPELARFNDLLAGLAERLKPAIVHVQTRREGAAEEAEPHPGEPRRTAGSGFIIDPAGLIVTNAHVVAGATTVRVRLYDGRRFTASVVGLDNRVDLAVLRVDGAKDLPTLTLGNSNRVRVGEFVLALGHPFGLEHSVSLGIVSRKGAPLEVAAPGFDFIQTDAAVNPGNSGGPLVNMAGEVVGVNSMAARNGSIGFAIPASLVQMLLPDLLAKGRIDWGWLGVAISDVSEEDLGRLKLKEARGVLIRSVMPGEPAEQGGIKPNDVIVAFDGTPVHRPSDLQRVVATTPVGRKARVRLLRDGQETEIEVVVGRYRDPEERAAEAGKPGERKPDGGQPEPGKPEK